MDQCCQEAVRKDREELRNFLMAALAVFLLLGMIFDRLWELRPKQFRSPKLIIQHVTPEGRTVTDMEVY